MKIIAEKEVEVGLGKDHFQGILIIEGTTEAQAIVYQGLDQEQVEIELELGVIGVENMILTKDCPTSKEEREIKQIQQVFNLDEGQTSLKTLATHRHDSLHKLNSLESITLAQEHLNLQKAVMTPIHFCL